MEGILYFLAEILSQSLAITEQTKILTGTNYALFSWWACPETFCEVLAYFLPSTRWLSKLSKQIYLFGFKAKQSPKFQQPPNYCHSCSVSPHIYCNKTHHQIFLWSQLTTSSIWTSINSICFSGQFQTEVFLDFYDCDKHLLHCCSSTWWLCLYYVPHFAPLWFPF